MTGWRLLKLRTHDAFTNMAIDEAILTARIEDSVPNTLRFYRWKPSAVSIGRFQDLSKEVHVENCRRNGVDIVRRITGGGTVYHDSEDEITYSVVVKEQNLQTNDVVEAYNKICNGLIEAAKLLGIRATFDPGDPRNCPNITVDGKKISGSAQFHRGGVLLQHGTFLVRTDLKCMFRYLRVPWARTIADVVCVGQEKLTSIERQLHHKVSIEAAHGALINGFRNALDVEPKEGKLTANERKLAEKLRKEKFSTSAWNLKGDA